MSGHIGKGSHQTTLSGECYLGPNLHPEVLEVDAVQEGLVSRKKASGASGGWTKSISHHFESMVETIICWYLRGESSFRGFLGGAGFLPLTVVNISKEWFPMVSKWCDMEFVYPQGNHLFVGFCGGNHPSGVSWVVRNGFRPRLSAWVHVLGWVTSSGPVALCKIRAPAALGAARGFEALKLPID